MQQDLVVVDRQPVSRAELTVETAHGRDVGASEADPRTLFWRGWGDSGL
jgi:hypothetical protein